MYGTFDIVFVIKGVLRFLVATLPSGWHGCFAMMLIT